MTAPPVPSIDDLSVAELVELPPGQLVQLVDGDFMALVKLAVAQACRPVPAHMRALLRGRCEDWADALGWAQAELQVALERMGYEGADAARIDYNRDRLRRVRLRAQEVQERLRRARRAAHRDGPDGTHLCDPHATAVGWLLRALTETGVAIGLPAHPHAGLMPAEAGARIEMAIGRGWLSASHDAQVQQLQSLSPARFRNVVADDAREQDARNLALRHPLLIVRWRQALAELREMTAAKAGMANPTAMGALRVDLATSAPEEAYRLLGMRRFFAACCQRWNESNRVLRGIWRGIDAGRDADPAIIAYQAARRRALDQLVKAHQHEYHYIRRRLTPYTTRAGRLDPNRLDTARRAQLKTEVITSIVDGAWRPVGDTP